MLNNTLSYSRCFDENDVCALQWQRCVENAKAAFADMSKGKVVRVCYENFIQQLAEELMRILSALGIGASPVRVNEAVSGASSKNVDKGRAPLSEAEVERLEASVGATLDRYGYRS